MTTGAGEDKDARLIILLESLERLAQRCRGCRIDRVTRLRPVERQDADMAFIFIDDGAHDASLPIRLDRPLRKMPLGAELSRARVTSDRNRDGHLYIP